jgi:hypothetical protein
MVQLFKKEIKDLGLQREVFEALPYAVVGGAYEGSFAAAMAGNAYFTALNYVVPHGQQLKILFLRICTQETGGARFSIYQTNPVAAGATGTVEAYPVVGSVPSGARDYMMLEAPGEEVLRGSLVDPVHVLEGSIDFRILAQYPGAQIAGPATGARYNLTWWGCIKVPEQED